MIGKAALSILLLRARSSAYN